MVPVDGTNDKRANSRVRNSCGAKCAKQEFETSKPEDGIAKNIKKESALGTLEIFRSSVMLDNAPS